MDQEIDAMFDDDRGPGKFGDALTEGVTPSADALDKEVDALFSKAAPPASSVNNLDDEYEAMFGPSDKDSNAGPSATGGVLARPSTVCPILSLNPLSLFQIFKQLFFLSVGGHKGAARLPSPTHRPPPKRGTTQTGPAPTPLSATRASRHYGCRSWPCSSGSNLPPRNGR